MYSKVRYCECSNYNCEVEGQFEIFSNCPYCGYTLEPIEEYYDLQEEREEENEDEY